MAPGKGYHTSLRVNGILLKRDRKVAGYTQVSFSEACGSVSLVTVRRAEQGHRIIRSYLERMASVLGQPVRRYIADDAFLEEPEYVVSLDGEWRGFFVESDRGVPPYVVEEEIVFRQKGAVIDSDHTCYCPGEVRRETMRGGRVIKNIIWGVMYPQEWPLPSGLATYFAISTRSNDWLEGFTSWYDADSGQVETSRLISVRKSSPSYLKYLAEARRIMETECKFYRMRNLMERGYGFEEAAGMLLAMPDTAASQAVMQQQPRPLVERLRIEDSTYVERMNLSYEGFMERIIALDRGAFTLSGGPDRGAIVQWAEIFRERPECWRVLTYGDEVVGYWLFLPLVPEKMARARKGVLAVSTLSPADIRRLDTLGSCSIYLVGITCRPRYRFGHGFRLLLESILAAIEMLTLHGVFIDEVVFAGRTPVAERLGRRLGFARVAEMQPPALCADGGPAGIYAAAMRDILASGDLGNPARGLSVRRAYGMRPG